MNKNFEDYKKEILAQYNLAKEGRNADLLQNPTPGNLKRLCLQLLDEELNNSDEQAFLNFFFPKEGQTLQGLIRKMNADGLRTPSDFLRTGQGLTNHYHANLIAVLVDFNPRPYVKFQKTVQEKSEEEILKKDISVAKPSPVIENKETAPITSEIIEKENFNKAEERKESKSFTETQILPITKFEDIPAKRNWKKKIVTSLAVVFFISLTGFLVHKSTEPKCMIWKEDHYERIDCEQSSNLGLLKFAQVFPYDEILFEKFKKLAISDTTSFFNTNGDPIVWYSKQNNECEYFTWEGVHPISRKKLKPISRTIINNHVLKWGEK